MTSTKIDKEMQTDDIQRDLCSGQQSSSLGGALTNPETTVSANKK